MAYAANGNILAKQGIVAGAALAGGGDTGSPVALSDYKYESPRPHAVTGVTATTSTSTSVFNYAYDANGNLTTRERRVGGVVKETWSTRWAGFDKPRWLINATTAKGDEFTYNANRSRVVHLSIDAVNGTDSAATPKHYSRKKVYGLGPQLEADYEPTASFNPSVPQAPSGWALQKLRIYVPGPEGTAGTMEFNPQQSFDNAESALVYHYDHLGSIERITPHGSTSTTYVLDGQGKPSRYSYDAWGQRRNPDTWSGAPTTTADGGSDDATPRGYTGHEMLDDLGLVHMNGRIYDPLIGRFLSADVQVQYPDRLQNFNRYSYVDNNPLTRTDPSGFGYFDEWARKNFEGWGSGGVGTHSDRVAGAAPAVKPQPAVQANQPGTILSWFFTTPQPKPAPSSLAITQEDWDSYANEAATAAHQVAQQDAERAQPAAPDSGEGIVGAINKSVYSITRSWLFETFVPGQAAWNRYLDSGQKDGWAGIQAGGEILLNYLTLGLGTAAQSALRGPIVSLNRMAGASGAPGMIEFGVRPGGGLGAHFAWRVGNTAMHANGTKPLFFLTPAGRRYAARQGLSVGEQMSMQRLSTRGAAEFLDLPGTFKFRLPAINRSLALGGEGGRSLSCFTSAWNAWSRANYHIPNAALGYGAYEMVASDEP